MTTGAREQGAHPQGPSAALLLLLTRSPAFQPRLPEGPCPEATNLLGTAHSPAPQWPLAWARTSPEGTGAQWLSGSRGDRSSPGGIVWGHWKWDLGAMAGSTRARGGIPTLERPGLETRDPQALNLPWPRPSVLYSLSDFWACWLAGAPQRLTVCRGSRGASPRKPLWPLRSPASRDPGHGTCPHWSHQGHHPSVACRPHCSGLSAGPVATCT